MALRNLSVVLQVRSSNQQQLLNLRDTHSWLPPGSMQQGSLKAGPAICFQKPPKHCCPMPHSLLAEGYLCAKGESCAPPFNGQGPTAPEQATDTPSHRVPVLRWRLWSLLIWPKTSQLVQRFSSEETVQDLVSPSEWRHKMAQYRTFERT